MNTNVASLNLVGAWVGILLGFVSGALLGLGFRREEWLGGYSSFRRRLYRLGHISFFGLALLNLMFYFSVSALDLDGASAGVQWAARGFLVGAITMPCCCLWVAHVPRAHAAFAVPVVSLLTAGGLTLWQVARATLNGSVTGQP